MRQILMPSHNVAPPMYSQSFDLPTDCPFIDLEAGALVTVPNGWFPCGTQFQASGLQIPPSTPSLPRMFSKPSTVFCSSRRAGPASSCCFERPHCQPIPSAESQGFLAAFSVLILPAFSFPYSWCAAGPHLLSLGIASEPSRPSSAIFLRLFHVPS